MKSTEISYFFHFSNTLCKNLNPYFEQCLSAKKYFNNCLYKRIDYCTRIFISIRKTLIVSLIHSSIFQTVHDCIFIHQFNIENGTLCILITISIHCSESIDWNSNYKTKCIIRQHKTVAFIKMYGSDANKTDIKIGVELICG